MKKYFTILPIINLVVAIIYTLIMKNMEIFSRGSGYIIALCGALILAYGGLAAIGAIAALVEKMENKNLKVLLVKIGINFILSFIIISIVFCYTMFANLLLISKAALLLALENIAGYGIVSIIKYSLKDPK